MNCTFVHNQAIGGTGNKGGAFAGDGIGGGLMNGFNGSGVAMATLGGSVCLDAFTQAHVKKNHASISNDDLFGVFTTCP